MVEPIGPHGWQLFVGRDNPNPTEEAFLAPPVNTRPAASCPVNSTGVGGAARVAMQTPTSPMATLQGVVTNAANFLAHHRDNSLTIRRLRWGDLIEGIEEWLPKQLNSVISDLEYIHPVENPINLDETQTLLENLRSQINNNACGDGYVGIETIKPLIEQLLERLPDYRNPNCSKVLRAESGASFTTDFLREMFEDIERAVQDRAHIQRKDLERIQTRQNALTEARTILSMVNEALSSSSNSFKRYEEARKTMKDIYEFLNTHCSTELYSATEKIKANIINGNITNDTIACARVNLSSYVNKGVPQDLEAEVASYNPLEGVDAKVDRFRKAIDDLEKDYMDGKEAREYVSSILNHLPVFRHNLEDLLNANPLPQIYSKENLEKIYQDILHSVNTNKERLEKSINNRNLHMEKINNARSLLERINSYANAA